MGDTKTRHYYLCTTCGNKCDTVAPSVVVCTHRPLDKQGTSHTAKKPSQSIEVTKEEYEQGKVRNQKR